MKDYNKSIYVLLGRMALEYRLSLSNICKILGWEPTEENRMKFYHIIEEVCASNYKLLSLYKYLFFFETDHEKESASKISYSLAINFLNRYKKALKDGDTEKAKKILRELNRTELEMNNVLPKLRERNIDRDDAIKISKYRIKHVIARDYFAKIYDITPSMLLRREKNIESELITYKLDLLSDYFEDIIYKKKEYKKR